jgi:chromosome partitioning protein
MAKVIGVVGEKGGGGKSTISHLLGHGAGSLPNAIDAIVATTDPNDQPVTGRRRYLPMDTRNLADLAELLRRVDGEDRLLIIVDGAASRTKVDEVLADVADLLIVPYGPSPQDTDRAVKHLDRIANAVAVPNRWPTHPATAKSAERWLDRIPTDRRLPIVPQIAKASAILDEELYPTIATTLSRPGQSLLLHALHRMGVHPIDLAARKE